VNTTTGHAAGGQLPVSQNRTTRRRYSPACAYNLPKALRGATLTILRACGFNPDALEHDLAFRDDVIRACLG
jgi:hypothetical protein